MNIFRQKKFKMQTVVEGEEFDIEKEMQKEEPRSALKSKQSK